MRLYVVSFLSPFYPYLSEFLQAWHLTGFLKLKCIWRPKVLREVIVEWVLPLWYLLSLGSRNSRIVNWYSTWMIWSLNFSLCIQEKNQRTAVGVLETKWPNIMHTCLGPKPGQRPPPPSHESISGLFLTTRRRVSTANKKRRSFIERTSVWKIWKIPLYRKKISRHTYSVTHP